MAEEAATAEEEEGDIHEDQKLLPRRDGESIDCDAVLEDEDNASGELVEFVELVEEDASGGSVSLDDERVVLVEPVRSGACEVEAVTELMFGWARRQ